MDSDAENREERRFVYRWPIWFGKNLAQTASLGVMDDVSSGGIAFTSTDTAGPLQQGQTLTVRFSLPRFDTPDPKATIGVTRTGRILWITAVGNGAYRIGLQFDTPLSLKPAEEAALLAVCRDGAS